MLYLTVIFLPVAGGFLSLFLPLEEGRRRAIYMEVVALCTTALVWRILLSGEGSFVWYRFVRGFYIAFAADGAACLFAGMVSIMWPLALLYAFSYMKEDKKQKQFFAFYLITYGITLGTAFSENMISLYIFYEMLSLVTIPLVSHYGDHESMYAGRKYAAYTLGGASLGFLAVVISAMYGQAGAFIYGGSITGGSRGILLFAYALGFFGFGVKAAVFPLYDWLPTASVAPTPVTALLHAVAVVNAGAFSVMRLTYYVYGADVVRGTVVQQICISFAVFSILFGAVMALRQSHFKRRLAFSTMSNLSYMLYGFLLCTPDGFAGGLSHLLFHGIIKFTLFLSAGAFMLQTGKASVYDINGVGRKMPVTFTCYTLGALSLTGIPGFCGFVSKWTLLSAGASDNTAMGVIGDAALVAAAFLCAMYTLTVSLRAFFPGGGTDRYSEGEGACVREADWKVLLPICVFTIASVVLGLFPGAAMSFIRSIAGGVR